MSQKIVEIAESIQKHRNEEIDKNIKNVAIARIATLYGGQNRLLWLVNFPINIEARINSFGFVDNVQIDGMPLQGDGHSIFRDSKLGELLIRNNNGVHQFQAPGGNYIIEFLNKATYTPYSHYDNSNVSEIKIILPSNDVFIYNTLSEIIELQKIIVDAEDRLKHTIDPLEIISIEENIETAKNERELKIANAQKFIRRNIELRYQPILDPFQEEIKRSKIYQGCLVINGGPGAGKTTSLIQRIKFLISRTIQDYFDLREFKDIIFDNIRRPWVFYSPNKPLSIFLQKAMMKEGLNDTAIVWSEQLSILMLNYKIIIPGEERPFVAYLSDSENRLIKSDKKSISNVINDLTKYFIDYHVGKLNKVKKFDTYIWTSETNRILRYIQNQEEISSIYDLIRIYLNLKIEFASIANNINLNYNLRINNLVGFYISKLNVSQKEEICNLLNINIELEQSIDEFLIRVLRPIIRKVSLAPLDDTRLTAKELNVKKYFQDIDENTLVDELGQLAFFIKYIEDYLNGVTEILNEVTIVYKMFRVQQLKGKSENWNLELLNTIIDDEKNRIHVDEQSLILLFINTICHRLYSSFKPQFESLKHHYLAAYKVNIKPVIAIDEATDFSILEILAINSLCHPGISSLTLSGDLMQGLTKKGLKQWSDIDINHIITDIEIRNLNISYRQSSNLLSVAKSIYNNQTGTISDFKSFLKEDLNEPKPLMFKSSIEDEKIDWIAKRIIEIYRMYEFNIPSIAIFLPSEYYLEEFSYMLGKNSLLANSLLVVEACKDGKYIGSNSAIRVFSIDKIKGLEFEAVFFHNLDSLQELDIDEQLLAKYLYVGLSRATFYLGVTVTNSLGSRFNYIESHFIQNNGSWLID
jgi:hypothetical protein